jgi:O-antigen/teichoic acid export membrane protein
VFASVGSNILNFIHAKKLCKIRFTLKFNWKEYLPPILIIFATNIAIKIYISSDTTMLGYLKDDYIVGIYSFSGKIYSIIKNVLAATMIVSIPRLAFYAGKEIRDDYEKLITRIANTLLVIAIPAMIGLIMTSKNVILILGGKKYEQAQSSMIILSIAIIFSIFSMLFNQGILLPYKKEKYSLRSSIVSAIENIGLNFFLIPLLAENGAAITTVLAEFTMATMNYYSSRNVAKNIFKNKKTIKNILTIIPGCVSIIGICLVVMRLVSGVVLQTILSIVLSVISYTCVLLIFRNPIAKDVFLTVRKKVTNH